MAADAAVVAAAAAVVVAAAVAEAVASCCLLAAVAFADEATPAEMMLQAAALGGRPGAVESERLQAAWSGPLEREQDK
jgi:hypothetical protein